MNLGFEVILRRFTILILAVFLSGIYGCSPGVRLSRAPSSTPEETVVKERTPKPGPVLSSLRPEESSLVAMIEDQTHPRRVASLRLAEHGRRLLNEGEYKEALGQLEKSIAVDSTNPYGFLYLAKAHYHMAQFQESLNFLDVAEAYLSGKSYWLAEVFALRGENYRALGSLRRARSNYEEALRYDPRHQVAREGLAHADQNLDVIDR